MHFISNIKRIELMTTAVNSTSCSVYKNIWLLDYCSILLKHFYIYLPSDPEFTRTQVFSWQFVSAPCSFPLALQQAIAATSYQNFHSPSHMAATRTLNKSFHTTCTTNAVFRRQYQNHDFFLRM